MCPETPRQEQGPNVFDEGRAHAAVTAGLEAITSAVREHGVAPYPLIRSLTEQTESLVISGHPQEALRLVDPVKDQIRVHAGFKRDVLLTMVTTSQAAALWNTGRFRESAQAYEEARQVATSVNKMRQAGMLGDLALGHAAALRSLGQPLEAVRTLDRVTADLSEVTASEIRGRQALVLHLAKLDALVELGSFDRALAIPDEMAETLGVVEPISSGMAPALEEAKLAQLLAESLHAAERDPQPKLSEEVAADKAVTIYTVANLAHAVSLPDHAVRVAAVALAELGDSYALMADARFRQQVLALGKPDGARFHRTELEQWLASFGFDIDLMPATPESPVPDVSQQTRLQSVDLSGSIIAAIALQRLARVASLSEDAVPWSPSVIGQRALESIAWVRSLRREFSQTAGRDKLMRSTLLILILLRAAFAECHPNVASSNTHLSAVEVENLTCMLGGHEVVDWLARP
jgi:tetratricopeptide (TPR) repeat protein